MNDADRILGELKEFKRSTIEELKEIREELKGLSQFRWKVAGSLSVLFAMAELIHVIVH